MIMHADSGYRALSRGRVAALTALAPLPFLAATMAFYRMIVTLPDPESAVAAVLLRTFAVGLVAVATLGSLMIASWVPRRMVDAHFHRLCAEEARRSTRGNARTRLRIVLPAPVEGERPA